MTIRRTWAWFGFTAGALGIGAYLWAWPMIEGAVHAPRPRFGPSDVSGQAVDSAAPHLTFEWRQRAVATNAGQIAWDVEISGTLELYDLAAVAPAEFVGRIHSTQVSLRGSEGPGQSIAEHLRTHSETPFRYRGDGTGLVLSAGFPKIERDNGYSHLRSTLAALQVGQLGGSRREELNSVGSCEVEYGQQDAATLRKKSSDCRYVGSGGIESARFGIEGSVGLDASRELATSRYIESTTIGEGGQQFVVQVTTELRRVAADRALNPFPDYQKWVLYPLHGSHLVTRAAVEAARSVSATELEQLGAKTYEDLASDLTKAAAAGDPQAVQEAAGMLRILFRAKPEAIKEARAQIQRGVPIGVAEPLMGAMSMASGAEAEAQLIELVQDESLDPAVREASIMHLGSVEAPSDNVVATLSAMSVDESLGSLRPQSITSLGASLRRGAVVGGSPVQEAAFEQLVEISDSAATTKERMDSMLALGNTASADALPSLSGGLSSADPMVRDSAVFALRDIEGAAVDQKIISVLANDPDITVRVSATRALAYRELDESSAQALLSAVQAEESSVVRNAVLGSVTAGRPLSEESPAYSIVDWMAESDPDADLKARAAALLEAVP